MSVNLIITVYCLSWAGDESEFIMGTVGEACGGRTRPENCHEKMTSLGLPLAGDESGGAPKRFCPRQNFWGGEDSAGPAQHITTPPSPTSPNSAAGPH